MLMPTVARYMTREPYAVSASASLAEANALMHAHAIRHIPVIDGGQLTGVVSRADVAAISNLPGVDLAHVEVARVMSAPLRVWGDTPLDEVAQLMSHARAECVVVLGGHGVAGIFTATDALAALSEVLRRATD